MLLASLALTLLHGTVTMGPVTPVCQVGTPCEQPAARVTLRFTRGTSLVKATTDARGRYRVSLRPGVWRVRASVGMSIRPSSLTIPRAAAAVRNFAIDTGIR